jgi:predicted MFS family arabinose efflux permease
MPCLLISDHALLTRLGPEDGWHKPHVIAMLIVGVALLVIFVFWERIWPNPLMPPHVWANRDFSLVMIIVNLGIMAFTGSIFWVSFFMQDLQKLSTITVAVHLLPMAVGGLIFNIIAAKILHKVNNTLLMAIGALAYLGASLLLSFMKVDSLFWAFMFPALVLHVAGADLQFCAGNVSLAMPVCPASSTDAIARCSL